MFAKLFGFHREKDDDEGIPSETEEDKKLLESKAKEMRGGGKTVLVWNFNVIVSK